MQVQADVTSASTLAEPQLPADVAISERGLDDFDAWDEDTQKQWKRFMKGSRSQEVCPTCLITIKQEHSGAGSHTTSCRVQIAFWLNQFLIWHAAHSTLQTCK